jgi:hypothetical protein
VKGDGSMSVRGGYGLAYERNFGNVTFNVIQNPPNYAVLALLAGRDVPTIPITTSNFGPLSAPSGSAPIPRTSLRHVREDIRNAYAHFWSASFEQRVGRDNLLSLEYSGSAGRKLYSISQFNIPGERAVMLGGSDPNARLLPQYGTINTRGNDGYSNYNALIVGFRGNNLRRTGLQFTANYTYAAAKDNLSEGSFNGNVGFSNPYQPSLDYGYADFDVRHRFISSFDWAVPVLRDDKSWRGNAFGGWTLAGIFSARTGTPFTIFDSGANVVHAPRLVPSSPVRVNVTDTGGPDLFTYINLAGQPLGAFVNPLCGCSDFGPYPANMTKRNEFRGPGIWNFDMAVYKTFRLSEKSNIQLRAEAFNVFNHSNLYVVAFTNDVGNGAVQAARGVTPNANLERRNMQLAVKFTF